MSPNDIPEERLGSIADDPRSGDLEARITALEEKNQELEVALQEQQTGGVSDMTRRGALGVLGGGALLGAAGSASAKPGKSHDKKHYLENEVVADRDEIQDMIDEAAANGGGQVWLKPTITYDLDEPIEVKRGVGLQCNGANFKQTTDIDMFHIWPEARVFEPFVDVSGVEYTSSVFVFDPAFDGNYIQAGEGGENHNTGLWGGRTVGTQTFDQYGGGTAIHFRQSGTGFTHAIAFVEVEHSVYRMGKGVEMEFITEDNYGFINGNKFTGNLVANGINIHQHITGGHGPINNNIFRGYMEPARHDPPHSKAGWLLENGGKNVFLGHNFDPTGYQNEAGWHIGPDADGQNTFVDFVAVMQVAVVDEANDPTNSVASLTRLGGYYGETDSYDGLAFGDGAKAIDGGLALGLLSSAIPSSTTLGNRAAAEAENATAVGESADASGNASIALGQAASVSADNGARIAAGQLAVGAQTGVFTDDQLNKGEVTFETHEDEGQLVVRYKDSSGTVRTGTVTLE